MPTAAIYARKSTESEDRQCLSLPAQVAWAREACSNPALRISTPLILQEQQSAKRPGRPVFEELMSRIDRGEIDSIVCWKADRLARNAADAGRILFALESQRLKRIITSDGTYGDDGDSVLMLGILLGFSAKYSKDLAKNVRRGLEEKWRRGEWSFMAPFGYRNVRLNADRAVIELHEENAELVRKLFELAATGHYSLNKLATIVRDQWHVALRANRCTKSDRGVSVSAIEKILKNPFYFGVFRVKGRLYNGAHPPLISKELFDAVQLILQKRRTSERPKKYVFTYAGLLRCGGCGRRFTGYTKRKPSGRTYIYYVCGKHLQRACTEPQVSEHAIDTAVVSALQAMSITQSDFRMIEAAVSELEQRLTVELHDTKARIERAVTDIRERQGRLLDLMLTNAITREEFDWKKRELETDRAAAVLADSAFINSAETFELTLATFLPLVDAVLNFEQTSHAEKRAFLRNLGFELRVMNGTVLVDAGKPATLVAARKGSPLGWSLVEDVWNCIVFRSRLAGALSGLLRYRRFDGAS